MSDPTLSELDSKLKWLESGIPLNYDGSIKSHILNLKLSKMRSRLR